MAVEQILGGIDVEGGMGLLVKGTQPDPLLAEAGTIRLPVVALQILQQRNALFEPLQILGHDAVFLQGRAYGGKQRSSQARMVGGAVFLEP